MGITRQDIIGAIHKGISDADLKYEQWTKGSTDTMSTVASNRVWQVREARREGQHLLSERNRQQRSGRMSDGPDTTALTGASSKHDLCRGGDQPQIVDCGRALPGCLGVAASASTHWLLPTRRDCWISSGRCGNGVARELGARPRVMLTYEAGYEGFWLARDIERRDAEIDIFMNDPASLRVNRRAKKKKTDRIDARRMVRALKAWDQGAIRRPCPGVRVPDVDRGGRQAPAAREGHADQRAVPASTTGSKGALAVARHLRSGAAQAGLPRTPRGRADGAMGRRCRRGRVRRSRRAVRMLRLVEDHIEMIEAEKKALLKAGRKTQDATDGDGTAMIAALTRIHGIGPQ